MVIRSAALSPSTVSVGGAVMVEVVLDEITGYFFTAEGQALVTADGQCFKAKESED
jgi:hypothetical protein